MMKNIRTKPVKRVNHICKVLTCSLLCTVIGVQSMAFGLTLKSPSYKNGKVVLKGAAEPGKLITMTAVKRGGSLRNSTDFAAILDTVSDENGDFEFRFSISDILGGKPSGGAFTANIFEEGKEAKTIEFEYSSEESRKLAFEKLLAATDVSTVNLLVDKTSEDYIPLKNIGILCDEYNELDANRSDAAKMFIAGKTPNMTQEELAECFSKAVGICILNSSENVSAALDIINGEFEGVRWSLADSEVKAWLTSAVKAQGIFSDFSEFDDKYEKCNILYITNSARYTTIAGYIDKYAAALGISLKTAYTKYKNIKDENILRKVNQTLVSKLSTAKPETVEKFETIFTETVNAVALSGGSISGSGGGNSGGGGGSVSSSMRIDNSDVDTSDSAVNPDEGKIGFKDLVGFEWAIKAVDFLAEGGIINGTSETTFEPSRGVTREEFVKMMVNAFSFNLQNSACSFDDVRDGHWAYSFIASAENKGLIYGINDKEFGIGKKISRQDAAVMIDRAFEKAGVIPKEERSYAGFDDDDLIADYARKCVIKLYCSNVLNGKGKSFEPEADLNRAEAAMLIYGAMNKCR